AMAPYNFAGKSSTVVQVTVGAKAAPPVTIAVVATAPGIFTENGPTFSGDSAAVLNADGTVNSATNPAARGSTISVYGTGAGQTNPASANGTVTPANPAMPVAATTATIGGQTAGVVYAGGSPGLLSGVLQVNAVVPAGIA